MRLLRVVGIVLSFTLFGVAEAVPKIPLRVGLTVVTAVSDRRGDYESIKQIQSMNAESLRLKYSTEQPKPKDMLEASPMRCTVSGNQSTCVADDKPGPLVSTTVYRTVLLKDLQNSHLYLQQFEPPPAIAETVPKTTAVGTSAAVLNDLKTKGESQITVYQTVVPGAPLVDPDKSSFADYRLRGTIKRVEPNPVPIPVIVNGKMTQLPAIHAKGSLAAGFAQAEFYFLDDAQNPLTLRFKIDKTELTVIKINFPGSTEMTNAEPTKAKPDAADAGGNANIERSLATTGRAEVYGIYFSFNSDKIREESELVLNEIAAALAKNPAWKLNIEGHTDRIGGDPYNLDLSSRRAAAVKQALMQRYKIDANRLTPSGYGASRPKASNDTLEGRALNRRVELVKQ